MVYDTDQHTAVLFGGDNANDTAFVRYGDTWEWDGAQWVLRSSSGPAPRNLTAMAYDSVNHRAVLFGGNTNLGKVGDTWLWNGPAGTWTSMGTAGPGARAYHKMAYDSVRHKVVLFGGSTSQSGITPAGDTWEWDGGSWTQVATTGPSPRLQHHMAFDSAHGVTVLYGGDNGSQLFNDTWTWNGTTWMPTGAAGPTPARDSSTMAFVQSRGRVVLFGGYSGSAALADVWEWDGSNWVQSLESGPPARFHSAIVYDAARDRAVLFGGVNLSALVPNDTWERSHPVAVQVNSQPSDASACSMMAAGFNVAVTGTGPLTYHWRHATVPIDTGANPSAATATLSLTNIQPSDAGDYDCIVTNACGSVTSNAATLTVSTAPVISPQPNDAAICPAGSATFSVDATGTPAPAFHWQIESAPHGSNVWNDLADGPVFYGGAVVADGSGAASRDYVVQYHQTDLDFIRLRCNASNDCGSVPSNPAMLMIEAGPSILTQPAPATSCPTGAATFSITASGTSLAYQWQIEDDSAAPPVFINLTDGPVDINGVDRGTATGANSNPLVFHGHGTGGSFRCIVSGSCGVITSNAAAYTICPADADCNGLIQPADIATFVNTWFTSLQTGGLDGDIDGNGLVQPADIAAFVNAWFNSLMAGC